MPQIESTNCLPENKFNGRAFEQHNKASRRRLPLCVALATLVLLLGVPFTTAQAALKVGDLRCEYLTNPQGIDATAPRLSWISSSDQRNQHQTAYRILVASSLDKLQHDEGDLWDSGRVESDRSIQIPFGGKPLTPHIECFWKVRTWDQDAKESAWSEPANWSMGLLEPADWNAKWIGLEGEYVPRYLSDTSWIWYPEGQPEKSAPLGDRYFRRTIEIPKDRQIKRARYLATADSQCKAFINGRDIGGRDNYRMVKDTDLTSILVPGKNVIAVVGYNKAEQGSSGTSVLDAAGTKPAGIVARLTIEFDKGDPLVIATDADWKTANKETSGWNQVEFDDSSWIPAKKLGPVGMAPWYQVRAPEERRLPARYLRKDFSIDKPIQRATVYYSGLGLSELYLNGAKVGDAVLSPGATDYAKREFYVTADVTNQLRKGANAMGVVLGNGRFFMMRSRVYSSMPNYGFPKLLLRLRIEHTDGSVSDVVSDASWKMTDDGPILANNEYDGEEYDARKEFPGWNEPGFDTAKWTSVQEMSAPPGKLAAQMIEPIRVTQTIKPIAISEPTPGKFIFDMGQNMVGWCRLKVSGPAGTQVTLRHAETLKPDGTLYMANLRGAKVTDIYTLKGKGEEMWEPRFTYHGFRFVEVTGFPGKPTLASIEGQVVHDDVRPVGEFECSNPLVNQIYKNIVWGVEGNYRSLPTDCPQRDERQGWMGDRSEESKGESYLFDIAALYSKWLTDMEDSQKDSGSVPDVCPAHWPIYSDNVTWPSSTVLIPNMLERQYGDQQIIARHYDSAKRWIDYMTSFVRYGLISKDQYGDWCVPPEDPILIHSNDPARQTSKMLLATTYFYHDLRLMEQYAKQLGRQQDADQFRHQADEMLEAFNGKLLDTTKGQYDNGTQTSCVLPLAFGMVPEDMHKPVFNRLIDKITGETKNHIGTGLIGGQFLNQALTDNGRADLAYTIASQSDYPSWGYMVSKGATTIWELWNGDTADPAMNSHNHVMLVGDLVIWFYEDLAGIAPDNTEAASAQPGFKHIVMKPHPVGDLKFVKASLRSPYGPIRSEWHHDGDALDWQISVPANTTATIYVPAANAEAVTESSKPARDAKGVKFVKQDGDRSVFEIGSGDYHFATGGK